MRLRSVVGNQAERSSSRSGELRGDVDYGTQWRGGALQGSILHGILTGRNAVSGAGDICDDGPRSFQEEFPCWGGWSDPWFQQVVRRP